MDAWPRCLERLEAELPAEDVHTWLKPLQAEQRDAMVLYAPNAFVANEVREPLPGAHPRTAGISPATRCRWKSARARADPVMTTPRRAPPGRTVAPRRRAVRRQPGQHYTFDNFVEGRSNQLGRAAAWQAAQKPGDRAHNPLLLYGGTGLGKTHLMFAAGNEMRRQNPAARCCTCARTVLQRLDPRAAGEDRWTSSSASSSRSTRC
jgi:chromosomal replication initiator protein